MSTTFGIALCLAGVVALVLIPIALNRVPLKAPPGLVRRLANYLANNCIETDDDSPFPERRLQYFRADPDFAYGAAREVVAELGWTLDYDNPTQLELGAVIVTPVLKFRDDFLVRVVPGNEADRVALFVRSRSRLGRGDLGANTAHLLKFYAAIAKRSDELAKSANAPQVPGHVA